MSTGVAGASDSCHIPVAWGLMRQPRDPEAFQGWIASDLGNSFTLVTKELGDIRGILYFSGTQFPICKVGIFISIPPHREVGIRAFLNV